MHHPIAICTDDPGVFDTTATQELMLVLQALEIPLSVLTRIVLESIQYAFCSDRVKEELYQAMSERIAKGKFE
jgi:adenosine deaminase